MVIESIGNVVRSLRTLLVRGNWSRQDSFVFTDLGLESPMKQWQHGHAVKSLKPAL